MLELKTKLKLSQESHKMAQGFGLVHYRNITYMPMDYETSEPTLQSVDPERTMWSPMNREAIRQLAADQFQTLFANDSELSSFCYMVAQNALRHFEPCSTLLVRTEDGLRELRDDGQLHVPSGAFVPNTLVPMLNTDQADKDRVRAVLEQWVDSEEEAAALLNHLATALAPAWSAVKYVLLLGEGRNGKSLLMKMLQAIFGWENCANVTRQQIAEQNPVVTELNGKLLNIVFDGRAEYVKDSGSEKSLIAGEVIPIRKLYESTPTPVQTNALFIEGLNREPKSTDKSLALQKRLIRFQFPNVYPLNHKFEKEMLAEKSLGALLALMIDHYVHLDEVAVKLAPTQRAIELQLEHMYVNSLAMQFIKYTHEDDPLGATSLLDLEMSELAKQFQSWRIKENDLGTWSEPDIVALFAPVLNTERRSKRIDGKPRKVRVVTGFQSETRAFLDTLEGSEDDEEQEVHGDLVGTEG